MKPYFAIACIALANWRAGAGVDFVRDVQPLLRERCVECHGPGKQKGGLRLDKKSSAIQGGDSGKVIVPGRKNESLLFQLISSADADHRMPPKGPPLSAPEIETIGQWIDAGAPWPDGASSPDSIHWSFAPIKIPPAPKVVRSRWVKNPIDAFILARLEKEHVAPAAEADRATLIRRLSLDLTGLPPSADEVRHYLADRRADAYERLVDRLLSSPHFGEQWGRHWLDLARYADSDGYEKDGVRPFAYLYRDWVIQALNADEPFDEFTIEQLAGDLLPGATDAQRLATGFNRNTLTNKEGGVDPEEFRCKAVVDRVNTVGAVWLGLTVGCAECHSHKYDPISQREYYQLFAFFNNASERELPWNSEAAGSGRKKAAAASILSEGESPRETFIHVRGDFLRRGEAVKAGTPAILPPMHSRQPDAADRLDLARWLVDPSHPLTSRVTVNRVWSHLFGRGLAPTLDDFGARGERPAHPELLDWLAWHFQQRSDSEFACEWRLKKLIRLIVTSATYRQKSVSRPELADRDPLNSWFSRQNRFRISAENVRDDFLAASGLLDRTLGGPSIRPALPPDIAAIGYANSIRWEESPGSARHRRGLYIFFQRTVPFPMLMTFDAPDSNVTCTRRERSNTPLQALTLLNDPAFVECARALGQNASKQRDPLGWLFEQCLSRPPVREERRRMASAWEMHRTELERHPDWIPAICPGEAAGPSEGAWVLLARVVLNLDEFVTRE